MAEMSMEYDRNNVGVARRLRRDMTRAERRLWYDGLRGCGVRFQRQKCIGVHIVDFYCHQARLAVELDGDGHYSEEGMERDRKRDGVLAGMGVEVMRFENREVMEGVEGVVERILRRVEERGRGMGVSGEAMSPPGARGAPPPSERGAGGTRAEGEDKAGAASLLERRDGR